MIDRCRRSCIDGGSVRHFLYVETLAFIPKMSAREVMESKNALQYTRGGCAAGYVVSYVGFDTLLCFFARPFFLFSSCAESHESRCGCG
jgi:hypothetical protein